MSKQSLYICSIICSSGDLCTVNALKGDDKSGREIQICLPKACGIERYINKKISCEVKNGRVKISEIPVVVLDDESTLMFDAKESDV